MNSYLIAVAIGSCVAVLVLLVAVLPPVAAFSDATPKSSIQPVNPISAEPIYTTYGNLSRVHNNTDASLLAGFTVRFPRIIPEGYSLQLAVVKPMADHNYGTVYLFYSKTPISRTTTLSDIEHSGGLLAEFSKLSAST